MNVNMIDIKFILLFVHFRKPLVISIHKYKYRYHNDYVLCHNQRDVIELDYRLLFTTSITSTGVFSLVFQQKRPTEEKLNQNEFKGPRSSPRP